MGVMLVQWYRTAVFIIHVIDMGVMLVQWYRTTVFINHVIDMGVMLVQWYRTTVITIHVIDMGVMLVKPVWYTVAVFTIHVIDMGVMCTLGVLLVAIISLTHRAPASTISAISDMSTITIALPSSSLHHHHRNSYRHHHHHPPHSPSLFIEVEMRLATRWNTPLGSSCPALIIKYQWPNNYRDPRTFAVDVGAP